MNVPLNRTFSTFEHASEGSEEASDYQLWLFRRNNTGLSWSDFLKKRVVIILGEMGIGKTFEFQHQAICLQQEDKAAFFLPLNQINSRDSAQAVLDEQAPRFEKWLRSNEVGYFLLDAVDEARLNGPPALQAALRAIRDVLRPHLQRISFFVSSRVTDWCVPGVQETVEQTLLRPICDVEASNVAVVPADTAREVKGNKNASSIQLEVYCLDPLSKPDAKRLAEAHGAKLVEAFWQAVEDGGYEFMASRPLDLEWMAKRWVASKKLGTYVELIETAVTHRLSDTNQSYIDSGAVLSPAQLREGAEQVAAACTFSGCPYVLVTADESMDSAISPADALPDWTPLEQRRLLGTAIFDEGTYGRVRFHHRAVREYLAACWVEHRLRDGLPFAHALGLFIQAPYGTPVLLNSRRPVLCWLASLNARVREHVIRQFPEMLMFGGDPQCWSTDDVVEACRGYIRRLEAGYRPDWWNDASERRRVARMLPPDLLAEGLSRYSKSPEVLYELLRLINDGKVTSSADAVFALYCAPEMSDRDRCHALVTLASVAKPDQRQAIAIDLVSGKLQSDELIVTALRAVGLQALTVEELTEIFRRTQPTSNFVSGPMARAVKSDLLPAMDFQTLQKLLTAILRVLPGECVQDLTRRSATGKPREVWTLSVLPDCLLRAVELMVGDGTDAPQVLVDAALAVKKLKYSIYVNNEDYRSLRAEIEKHQGFRRRVALAIALSEDVRYASYGLIWSPDIVCITREDLDWLLCEAMRGDTDPAERQIWYEVVRDIALHQVRGRSRQQALIALTAGVDGPARATDIETVRAQRIESVQTRRGLKREERARKTERQRQLEESKAQFLKEIDVIREGSGFPPMQWLISHAAESSSPIRYTKVSLEPIGRDFGQELAEAFSEGLTKVWRQISVPTPADYPANRVPWVSLIGLASVNHAFATGLDVQRLSAEDITRAVQLCVWEIERPESWLDKLVEFRVDTVVAALMPWFEHELGLTTDDGRAPRTVDFVLRAPHALQRPFLQRAVELIRDSQVRDERLQMRLFRARTEMGVPSKELIGELASRHLMSGAKAEKPASALDWFATWAEIDLVAAWSWLETNPTAIAQDAADLARFVAEGLKHASWDKKLSGTEAEATALVSLFRFLSVHADASQPKADEDEGLSLPHPIRRVRDSIPSILASLSGKAVHAALQELVVENAGTAQVDRLQRLALEHASAEAERRSVVSATELPRFGEVYCREPRTEEELYAQVVARLQEMREGIEGGPFSDRVLFAPGMDEKMLQLWLAARLSDTPLRRFIPRFKVHREPQVDDDKRLDHLYGNAYRRRGASGTSGGR